MPVLIRVFILIILLTLGMVMMADIPETDSSFYTNVLVWLFIALLISLTK